MDSGIQSSPATDFYRFMESVDQQGAMPTAHSVRYLEEEFDEGETGPAQFDIDWGQTFSKDPHRMRMNDQVRVNSSNSVLGANSEEEFYLETGLLVSLGIDNCNVKRNRNLESSRIENAREILIDHSGLVEPYYLDVYPLAGSEEYFFVGMCKVPLNKDDRVSEILIRPDVAEESVLVLVETLLMAFNGSVSRRPSMVGANTVVAGLGILTCSAVDLSSLVIVSGSSSKYCMRAYLTVNAKLQRVLIVHLAAETNATTAGAKLASALLADPAPVVHAFFHTAMYQLAAALYGECFSLPYLINISCHATCAINKREYDNIHKSVPANVASTQPVLMAPFKSGASNENKKKKKKKPKLNPFDDSDDDSDEGQQDVFRRQQMVADVDDKRTEGITMQPRFDSGFTFSGSMLSSDVGLQLESVIDPSFVRDLQVANAQIMTKKLIAEIEPMEKEVKQVELSCARLMTVLKSSYQRCGLNMPSPPNQKALTEYELPLTREPITEVSLDTARLLILRARRSARDKLGHIGMGSTSSQINASNTSVKPTDQQTTINSQPLLVLDDDDDDDAAAIFGITALNPGIVTTTSSASVPCNNCPWADTISDHIALLTTVVSGVIEQLTDWQDGEYAARLSRKTAAVSDRLRAIEDFKLKLVSTLHYRNVSHTTAADRAAIDSLKEKCRVINDNDPLLLDMPAVHAGRSGTLYVTLDHIFFYSYGGIFQALFVKLFPIRTLVNISSQDASSTFGAGSVVLEDEGGTQSLFEIAGPTGDFHTRVSDVLNQLQQVFMLHFLSYTIECIF